MYAPLDLIFAVAVMVIGLVLGWALHRWATRRERRFA